MKKIYLILALLLLSGCSINYNLDIEDDGLFKETITGTVTNKELDDTNSTNVDIYSYSLNTATPLIDNKGQYKKEIIDKNKYKEFKYTYTFDNNYKSSNILNTCFTYVLFDESEDYYNIDLYGPFKCMYSDKINISVTSKYAITDNNADKVNKNTYTWTIKDKDNANIHLEVNKKIEYKESNKKYVFTSIRIVSFIILLILSAVTYYLYKKRESDI